MKTLTKLWDKFHEFIMYMVFGILTTVVSWVSYAIFTLVINDASFWGITISSSTIANVLSWICAVMFAFVTNKIWVFNSKSWKIGLVFGELFKFVSTRLLTGVIEWVGLPLLVSIGVNQTIFGIKDMVAKVLVSVIVVILNYAFSKLLIFRNKSQYNASKLEKIKSEDIVEQIYDDIHNS